MTLPGIALGIVATLLRRSPLIATGPFDRSLTSLPMNLARVRDRDRRRPIFLIRWIYWLVRRHEGIGLGDAKLMAMLAAWLGLPGALLAFAIGVVLGAAVGVVILLKAKTGDGAPMSGLTKLPLGTFLCIGGIVSALWGSQILGAYLRWAGLA